MSSREAFIPNCSQILFAVAPVIGIPESGRCLRSSPKITGPEGLLMLYVTLLLCPWSRCVWVDSEFQRDVDLRTLPANL